MVRLSALMLVLPVVAVAAPVPKGEKKVPLYFPVTVGAKRVLERTGEGGPVAITETVTKVEERDGTYSVTAEQEFLGRKTTDVWEVSADGLTRSFRSGQQTPTDPQRELKLGAKAGDRWTSRTKRSGTAMASKTTYTMGREEEVDTPAGKFKAVKVEGTQVAARETAEFTSWYVRGVGEVKRVQLSQGEEAVTVLKEFTPGREEKKVDAKKEESRKGK